MDSASVDSGNDSFLPEADEIIDSSNFSASGDIKEEEESLIAGEDEELQSSYGVSAYGLSAASGTNAAASKRGLPKLREILRRQKQDSEDEDTPDIEYIYEDEDSFGAEIAELYSYTENPEFPLAQKAFEDTAEALKLPSTWTAMEEEQKCAMIQMLLDKTEVAGR